MAACSTFTLFPLLPLEIRLQIWDRALPPDIQPILFPCRPNQLQLTKRSASQFESRLMPSPPYRHELCWRLDFSLLDNFAIPVPLAIVNRESRAQMQHWIARQKGFDLRAGGSMDRPAYLRDYHVDRDALYIPLTRSARFKAEMDRRHDGSLRTLFVTRFAVDEAFFMNGEHMLDLSIMSGSWWPVMLTIVIVMKTPRELTSLEGGASTASQWEFADLDRGFYTRKGSERWDGVEDWVFVPGRLAPEARFCRRMEELIEGGVFAQRMFDKRRSLEVRPVEARKRGN